MRDLRAAWEPKPPVSAKPSKPEPRERKSRREVERSPSSKVMMVTMLVMINDGVMIEKAVIFKAPQCTMIPLSTRSCLKSNKLRPILNGQFYHAIFKNIGLNLFGSKQPREILVFVILKL